MDEIENDLKGIKINAELFKEENLDDLEGIEDDENPEAEETHKRGMIIDEEDEKETDH